MDRSTPTRDRGLYFFDTRLISTYRYFANGVSFELLNAGAVLYYASRTFLTNGVFETEDGAVAARSIGLVLSRTVGGGLHEDFDITNYGPSPIRFNLELLIRCDFADLFDVKAGHLIRRGRITNSWDESGMAFSSTYFNAGFRRALNLRIVKSDSPGRVTNGRLTFEVEIAPGSSWYTCLCHDLVDGDKAFEAPRECFAHAPAEGLGSALEEWRRTILKLETSNEEFFGLFKQSVEDMASLRLSIEGTDHLRFVAANGVPWFVTLFGRDSLIAALQTVFVYPDFARGALEVLGELQATETDDYRDAEPGRILHELRHGELAKLGKVPHTPYYGTADATPLYIIALHETWS